MSETRELSVIRPRPLQQLPPKPHAPRPRPRPWQQLVIAVTTMLALLIGGLYFEATPLGNMATTEAFDGNPDLALQTLADPSVAHEPQGPWNTLAGAAQADVGNGGGAGPGVSAPGSAGLPVAGPTPTSTAPPAPTATAQPVATSPSTPTKKPTPTPSRPTSGVSPAPEQPWPPYQWADPKGYHSFKVIYPMAKARGLQLARNDKAAASGLMTEARQSRNPAACAPSGADVGHFTLATIPARNPQMFSWEGAVQTVVLDESRCLSTSSVYTHERRRKVNGSGGFYYWAFGQCTWWAQASRKGEHLTGMGNARYWAANTKKRGLTVSSVPRAGSTVVFQPGVQGAGGAGHVAHVIRVYPGGWFLVSEMNFYWNGGAWGRVDYRYVHVGLGVSFIY